MDNNKIIKIISYYYLISFLFIAFDTLTRFLKYYNSDYIIPLWPISWINLTGIKIGSILIFGFAIISTIYAFRKPSFCKSRILAFASILLFVAFENSFGKINHYYHTWILVGFVFMFLNFKEEENNYQIFILAQAFFLITYTMSGLIKIMNFFTDYNLLTISGPITIIAKRLLESNSSTILGPFLISHPFIAWIGYFTILLIEFLSIFILFKPKYLKYYSLLIIGMHLLTYLVLKIIFLPAIILAFLLFIYPEINK